MIIKNATTMYEFTKSSDEGGRFAKLHEPSPASLKAYPPSALPNDPGLEPPLGYSINALEPVGTQQEIERSLKSLPADVAPSEALSSPVVSETVRRQDRSDLEDL